MVGSWMQVQKEPLSLPTSTTVLSCPLSMEGADPGAEVLLLDYPQLQGPH